MLSVKGLHAGYGGSEVLHGIDMVVPTGAVVALLGANGAGKTTLLRTLAGLVRATSGSITFNGASVERTPTHARSRAGLCLIPEGRAIFRQLTVRENLAAQLRGRNGREALASAVEAFPALEDRLDQVAGTLSGGEQQMLALARALCADPLIVLADELSVGLAPVVIDEIFAALRRLQANGQSMLIVEQYIDRVLEIADYVYILHKGHVVFVGEPKQCEGSAVFERYLGGAA